MPRHGRSRHFSTIRLSSSVRAETLWSNTHQNTPRNTMLSTISIRNAGGSTRIRRSEIDASSPLVRSCSVTRYLCGVGVGCGAGRP